MDEKPHSRVRITLPGGAITFRGRHAEDMASGLAEVVAVRRRPPTEP